MKAISSIEGWLVSFAGIEKFYFNCTLGEALGFFYSDLIESNNPLQSFN